MPSYRGLVRWLARLTSIASLMILFAFIIGTDEPNTLFSQKELLGIIFFPLGVIAGLILAWKSEWQGGLISIGSLAAFYGWHYTVAAKLPSGPWFFVITIPAFLFLANSILPQQEAAE